MAQIENDMDSKEDSNINTDSNQETVNIERTEEELNAKMNTVTENNVTVETAESLAQIQEKELSNVSNQDNLDDLKEVAAEVAIEVVTS